MAKMEDDLADVPNSRGRQKILQKIGKKRNRCYIFPIRRIDLAYVSRADEEGRMGNAIETFCAST